MLNKVLLAVIIAMWIVEAPRAALAQDGPEDLLDTVVVSASRTSEQIREVSSNVTVITGEQIERAAVDGLSDLLLQHGFWHVHNEGTMAVQIRGMGAGILDDVQLRSRVLILVNGRRTGIVKASQISLANVDRVEIIRGPSAVQYGTSALGGVINVITKRGGANSFSATAETGLGSFGLNKGELSFNGGYGGFDFSVAANRLERESISLRNGFRYPHTSLESKSAMLDVGYTFGERHRIGLNLSHDRADQEWPAVDFREYVERIKAGGSMGFDYEVFATSIKGWAVSYEGSSEGGDFDWSLSFGQSDYSFLYEYPSSSGSDYASTFQRTTTAGATAGYNNKRFDIDLGVDYVKYDLDGTFNGPNENKDLGIFLSSKIRLLDDALFVSLGGRYDDFSYVNKRPGADAKGMTNFSPSIGVSFLPIDWLKLRANFSEGFRMPTSFEYTGGVNSWGRAYHPNPNLQPEESGTLEFGLDIDRSPVTISLTYFQTDWKNKIISDSFPGGARQYINLLKAKMSGIELSASAELGQALELDFVLRPYLSFSYMAKRRNLDSTQLLADGSDTLPSVPSWTLSYGLTFEHAGLDLTANVNAAQFGSILHEDVWANPPRVIRYSPGLAFVDLAVEKGILEFGEGGRFGKVKLRFEAKNIFDTNNEIYYDRPGPGRNYYLGIKYQF